jgi:hypothetical protein
MQIFLKQKVNHKVTAFFLFIESSFYAKIIFTTT